MTRKTATALLGAVLALGAGAARAQSAGSLLVVHGIEGQDVNSALLPTLPVDLAIDGVCVSAQPLQFGNTYGPFPVPAGAHTVAISLASTTAPCSGTVVLSGKAGVQAGQQIAIVAAEGASGPTVDTFDLTLGTPVAPGTARAAIFHAANAPAVDVTLTNVSNGHVQTFSNLAPGTRVAGQTVSFTPLATRVYPAGGSTVVAGPLIQTPASRSVEALFIVGSAANGTVTVISREIHGVLQ